MDPFSVIRGDLERHFPGIEISIDPPLRETGVWHMDVKFQKHFVVVQWIPEISKFGVSVDPDPDDFTCQADELHPDSLAVFTRLIQAFKT